MSQTPTADNDRHYYSKASTATSRINASLAEIGAGHYTVATLQDRISMALKDTPSGDWITFKIPSASEVTFKRSDLEEALAETDPFEGL